MLSPAQLHLALHTWLVSGIWKDRFSEGRDQRVANDNNTWTEAKWSRCSKGRTSVEAPGDLVLKSKNSTTQLYPLPSDFTLRSPTQRQWTRTSSWRWQTIIPDLYDSQLIINHAWSHLFVWWSGVLPYCPGLTQITRLKWSPCFSFLRNWNYRYTPPDTFSLDCQLDWIWNQVRGRQVCGDFSRKNWQRKEDAPADWVIPFASGSYIKRSQEKH